MSMWKQFAREMHQRAMIATLEIDVAVALKTFVDQGTKPIGAPIGGMGSRCAMREQRSDLLLSGEAHLLAQPAPDLAQKNLT